MSGDPGSVAGAKFVYLDLLNYFATEQDKLVKEITANADNTFTEEFLRTKGLDELRGIAALAAKPATADAPTGNQGGVPMFIGQATPTGPTANADGNQGGETALPVPTMNFESNG